MCHVYDPVHELYIYTTCLFLENYLQFHDNCYHSKSPTPDDNKISNLKSIWYTCEYTCEFWIQGHLYHELIVAVKRAINSLVKKTNKMHDSWVSTIWTDWEKRHRDQIAPGMTPSRQFVLEVKIFTYNAHLFTSILSS